MLAIAIGAYALVAAAFGLLSVHEVSNGRHRGVAGILRALAWSAFWPLTIVVALVAMLWFRRMRSA